MTTTALTPEKAERAKKLLSRLSPEDINRLGLASREVLARRDYEHYFQLVNPELKMYPHIKLICDALQKIADGEQHYYIVEMPPQHGKSSTITKTFPSYYMMKFPERNVMISAYGDSLVSDFSESNRRIFEKWGRQLFGLRIGKNTSEQFRIVDHEGTFYATSMQGSASGKKANLLIIDDPLKNDKQSQSQATKTDVWREWTHTFLTRLQNNSSVIIIMTRWQIDDLAGKLLQNMSFPWEEIKLPAIATDLKDGETDAIGRHNGDPLCPQMHSKKWLMAMKNELGTRGFEALYQQSPTIESGNIFKRNWVKYFVPDRETMIRLGLTEKEVSILPPIIDEKTQSWDATFKNKENDDYVAGQVWFRREGQYYLMYWQHDRMTFTETLEAIKQTTKLYPDAVKKLIEDKANGSAIIDTLNRTIEGIVPIEPDGGKEVRAAAVSPMWEAGNVYVPHPRWKPEIQEMLEEMFAFPNAPHDDYVDAMTQALNYMRKRRGEIHNFL